MLLLYGLMVIVPALLLVVMVMLGGDSDIEASDLDLDAGDVDGDVSGVDGDADVSGPGGPGLLSIKLILSFLMGFGLAGACAVHFHSSIHHVPLGLVGGVLAYVVIYQALKLLYGMQANTLARGSSVIGRPGTVTEAITGAGVGEIKAMDPRTGQYLFLRAQAEDPAEDYTPGDQVIVKSVAGRLATVV